MAYTPTSSDLLLLQQSEHKISVRVDLLNGQFQTIGQLDGYLISDSYTIDKSSTIRRTASLSFVVDDDTLLIAQNKPIWFNRFIHIFIGYLQGRTNTYVWYDKGIYTWDTANYQYDSSSKTLTLSCLDVMGCLSDSRGSQISGEGITISAGSSLRTVLINTITQLGNITNYRIDNISETIPYDLEFGTGTYVYEILQRLVELYTGYEMFFDGDCFVFQAYPTYTSDPVVLDDDIIQPLVVSEANSVDFGTIKNVTEVWGTVIESDYYSGITTYANNTYTLSCTATWRDGDKYEFTAPNTCTANPKISLNNVAIDIVGENNAALTAGVIQANKMYIVKYRSSDNKAYFMGQPQIVGINYLLSKSPDEIYVADGSTSTTLRAYNMANEVTTNIAYTVDSGNPFAMDLIGELRQVLSDGDYSAIYSDELALQRATYETWKASAMLNTITLTLVNIPWLDVNQKIEYTSQVDGKKKVYLISNITSSTTGGTMTITAQVFQPEYSWN